LKELMSSLFLFLPAHVHTFLSANISTYSLCS